MKILLTNLRINCKIESEIVPKPIKSDPLGCLGGVWRPFWSQESPEELNYMKMYDFWGDFGVIWVSKMERKSLKELFKNYFVFYNDFVICVYQSWVDFGSKNLSKMMVPKVICSTLC